MKEKSYFDVSIISTNKRDVHIEPNLTGYENKRNNSKLMKKNPFLGVQ